MCIRDRSQAAPNDIPSVSGTMTIHQLVTVRRGEFIHRSISCACSPALNYNCACFSAKQQVYQVSQSTPVAVDASTDTTAGAGSHEQSEPQLKIGSAVEDWSNPALIGQYCCVEYDGKAYPGTLSSSSGTLTSPMLKFSVCTQLARTASSGQIDVLIYAGILPTECWRSFQNPAV